jgi:nucleoside-diphosphate-sugar epimerase
LRELRAVGAALVGADAVVHLAARVHVMRETNPDPFGAFRQANVESTRTVCEAARVAGIRSFVYLSSVKVHGEGRDAPYTEQDAPMPQDDYGRSKAEAEAVVARTLGDAVAWTILRPPLVYGPGVAGNFRRLLRLAELAGRIPLPLGRIGNRRSLIFVENLAAAIERSLAGAPSSRAWLVSDGEDMSTSELIIRVARALGRRATLVPVPASVMQASLRAIGRADVGERLFGNMRVDGSSFRNAFRWAPPVSVDEGIAATATWWVNRQSSGAA